MTLNPIHWDDEIAKVVGLTPRRSRHVDDGDRRWPRHILGWRLGRCITEYNVRFTAVVPVPNDGKGRRAGVQRSGEMADPESKVGDHRTSPLLPAARRFSAGHRPAKLA